MKKFLLLLLLAVFSVTSIMAQPPKVPANKGANFGEKITAADAISPDKLPDMLKEKTSVDVKVKGQVLSVCKAKGCFIYMKTATGKIYIKTKDDAFFVPLVLKGKTVVVKGTAEVDKESKDISIQATGILVI
jgi:hypothetical protein